MRAWQYKSITGGLEKSIFLNKSAPVPARKPNQHLVKVSVASLNPVDYKPAEVPLIRRLLIPNPATPACDFSGYIVIPADGSSLKPGQAVVGAVGKSPLAGGGLAEYALADRGSIVALPDGISMAHAASIPVAGWTAYQSIKPFVQKSDKLFINGGSGGTGVYGIQIAKLLGCHVTVTCSTANAELCKSLGADQVIDYRTQNVVRTLAGQPKFAHVVDNVGADPHLFWQSAKYTNANTRYIWIAGSPSLSYLWQSFLMRRLPSFLGGSGRPFVSMLAQPRPDELKQICQWMQEKKLRSVIDEEFSFEEVPQAFAKLKTGRAKGKIVVRVSSTETKGVEK